MSTDSSIAEKVASRLFHSRMRTRTTYHEGSIDLFQGARVESTREDDKYVVRWILRDGSQLVVVMGWSAAPDNQDGSSAVVQGEEVR
jgi:hypothetical protein